jgi:ferric-dicitrate binding protein FerR (iron transport regulator)
LESIECTLSTRTMDTAEMILHVLEGKASKQQRATLSHWVSKSDANKWEYNDIRLLWYAAQTRLEFSDSTVTGFIKIRSEVARQKEDRVRKTFSIVVVTILISLCTAYFYFFLHKPSPDLYLKFEKTPLSEVFKTLETTYDISISVPQEAILTCSFTGTFYRPDAGQDIVKSISQALGMHLKILSPQTLRLEGSGCANR